MHLCAQYFFRSRLPRPPSLENLLQFYEQNWLPQGFESAEEELQYRAYGREILSKFWEVHHTDFHLPLAVERMFCIDIERVKLRGFIDRVDKLESGGLSIVDYKTSQELFTNEDLENNLQLTLYQLASEQLWQLPVERLTLYHLRSNTPCSCAPRDKMRLEQARDLVLEVAENIARQRFPAIENEYCPCDFPEHCPYHRQRYLEAAPPPAHRDILAGMTAADVVEQYASLQGEVKELQKKLEELKQMLIDYCEAEGLNRVFGKENAVTYKLVEMTGFDEDEVRALLEPEGLWERVLGLDQSRLKQLLTDEEVAEEVRNKLEALRRVISAAPRLWLKKLREEE